MERKGELPQVFGVMNYMDQDVIKEVQMPKFEINKIADGLGYGEGKISTQLGEQPSAETFRVAEQLVVSPDIVVTVSQDKNGQRLEDDGCGDGRGVKRVLDGVRGFFKKSLHRSKVFGGGVVQGLAGRIANGEVVGDDLNDEFELTMDTLHKHGVAYGAHTDTHAHGENCGCGAIDKAPLIIGNALKYEDQIRGSIGALGIDEDLDSVFGQFKLAAPRLQQKPYSGKRLMDRIMHNGKIVKELDDDHYEKFIVLNMVEGYTVDQGLVRDATSGEIQIFATDVWRLQEIAEKMQPEDQAKQKQAFLGMLVYTLATAATLTDGTLPVYAVSQEQAHVA